MIFIFGIDHKTKQESESGKPRHCYHCNNTVQWKTSKETTWFTFFFVPVIPVKTVYREVCPICNTGYEISRNDYDAKMF